MNRVPYLSGFEGTRVLITGHTGFKGSWLSLWLTVLGAEVHGMALLPDQDPNLFTQAGVNDLVQSRVGDIRNPDQVDKVFHEIRPDLVIHLAAQSLVRRSYSLPAETYATNVMGTVHILEAARRCPDLRGVLIVTSDKCYENEEGLWGHRETDPMGGADPYSSSKGCAELVTAAFRRSFFQGDRMPLVASARAGNVIGGGDWSADRLVPDVARAINAGQPVVIRNPDSVRPWQHVLEPLRGYLMLGDAMLAGDADVAQAWNFGPDEADTVPVRRAVEYLIRAWGEGSLIVAQHHDAPFEAGLLKLEITKARELLGFRPVLGFERAIEWTAAWYRDVQADPRKARSLMEEQIVEYTSLLS